MRRGGEAKGVEGRREVVRKGEERGGEGRREKGGKMRNGKIQK